MSRSIGVFDSGVGGLTVLKSLRAHFPGQSFVYLGDTARLPYGSKSPDTIRQYLLQNLKFLKAQNVQAFVVACNSASTQVRESVWEGLPLYNVIDPGVSAALQASKNGRIGLLGTRATVESQIYQNRLRAQSLSPDLVISAQACPLFVPLAEEGWTTDVVTDLIIERYLAPLKQQGIDTLILGCTHYSILSAAIQEFMGPKVTLVDSGKALSLQLADDFFSGALTASQDDSLRLMMTDLSTHLQHWALSLIHAGVETLIEKVDLQL